MIEHKLIMTNPPIIVTNQDFVQDLPYIVAEQLITGDWILMTVHNLNDIDKENQLRVIGGVPRLPDIDFSQVIIPEETQKVFNCEFENKRDVLIVTKLY
jgi:hypothetical protein